MYHNISRSLERAPKSRQRLRPNEILGLTGLYLFSYTAVLGIAGANIGLLLMLLGMLPQLPEVWRAYRSSRVVQLVLLGIFYIVISAAIASYYLPETRAHQWDQLLRWGDLGLILLVAWWLKGKPSRFYISFALFAAGAFTRMFTFMPWDAVGTLLKGGYHPWGFGLWHISFSAYLVIVLLGLLLFAKRWLASVKTQWAKFLVILLLLIALVLCVEGILVSKSRGTWLAALLVLPVSLLLYGRTLLRSQAAFSRRHLLVMVGIGIVMMGALLIPQLDRVIERAAQEQETYRVMLEEDISKVPPSSVGLRIHMWKYGIERWLERPLFGWGIGSERYLMKEKWPEGVYGRNYYVPPHFHNIYLEILVRFGLVGFWLLASIVFLIYREVWRKYREGLLPADWFYFLFGTLAFSMIWGCFDIRVVKWDYRDFVLLFIGAALIISRPFAESGFFERLRGKEGTFSKHEQP